VLSVGALSKMLMLFVRWLYTLFLALDANFRMTRKNVSSELKDPALSRGFSYFVEETAFKEHLNAHSDEKQEVSFTLTGPHILLKNSLAQHLCVPRCGQ
jgi:hypothetical protein